MASRGYGGLGASKAALIDRNCVGSSRAGKPDRAENTPLLDGLQRIWGTLNCASI